MGGGGGGVGLGGVCELKFFFCENSKINWGGGSLGVRFGGGGQGGCE